MQCITLMCDLLLVKQLFTIGWYTILSASYIQEHGSAVEWYGLIQPLLPLQTRNVLTQEHIRVNQIAFQSRNCG